MLVLLRFLSVCLFLCIYSTGFAVSQPLRVGVVSGSPFAFENAGVYGGLAIDLWQKIAEQNKWSYQYLPTGEDVYESLQQLQAGKFDLLIGPISVNEKRLYIVDFSRPYFINNVGILLHKEKSRYFPVIDAFLSPAFALVLLAIALLFIIYLHLLWYFERGKHPDIPLSYREAISVGFWVHLFKKSGFSQMPITLYGRVIVLLWLLCLGLLFTVFNASVTSMLTVAKSKQFDSISDFNTLTTLHLVGPKGLAAVNLARAQGLVVEETDTLDTAIALLRQNKVDGVLYDTIAGQDYLTSHRLNDVFFSNFVLGQEEYAFAFPYNSPLRKGIDIVVTKLQDHQLLVAMCQKYIASQAKYCQL